jgi:uncharacterized Zn-binding protein involved in type VI secretion
MAGEIIRQGDPTSHGGKVLEGSLFDICHGKPIAFIGHKVVCPKCKGVFPIAEGVPTTTFYGKGVAIAGMKTACGATLIATQFTDIVEYGGGSGGQSSATSASTQRNPEQNAALAKQPSPSDSSPRASSAEIEEEHTYTLIDESGNLVNDYRYDLHCDDALRIQAAQYVDSATVSVKGVKTSRLVCWLEKDGASKS